jgi:hypothetical protein
MYSDNEHVMCCEDNNGSVLLRALRLQAECTTVMRNIDENKNATICSVHMIGVFGRNNYEWSNENYDELFPL